MATWPQLKRDSGKALRAAGAFAVDVVYPKRCAGCGRRGSWLCERCDATLERFSPPWCPRCGVPIILDECKCDRMPDVLTAVRSVGPFDGWLRGAVIQLKYHGEWDRSRFLGPLVADAISDIRPCDGLVPVPLHRTREKQRGFNQSRLVALEAARVLDLQVVNALQRNRHTRAQARLDAVQRHMNVEGAFGVRTEANVRGQSLVLVDDVITTGSTLAACVGPLLDAGAAAVAVVTISREL